MEAARQRRPRRHVLAAVLAVASVVAVIGVCSIAVSSNEEPFELAARSDKEDAESRLETTSAGAIHASQYVFHRINEDRAQCGKSKYTGYSLRTARRHLIDGIAYKIEIVTNTGEGYFVDVDHFLPAYYHPTASSDEAAQNKLLARFRIRHIAPLPCSEPETSLAMDPNEVNEEKLGWQAQAFPEFQGLTTEQFKSQKLGLVMPDRDEYARTHRKLGSSWANSDMAGYEFPVNFDTRDLVGHHCKAFTVTDQGNCGACYAFAAATALSARLCHQSASKFDVNISPQDILSCYGASGCKGGVPILVYEQLEYDSKVGDWCMPYTGQDLAKGGPACGATCGTGLKFGAIAGSTAWSFDSVAAMQMELLINGPVALGFRIYTDFMMYRSGVYSTSEAAKRRGPLGGHAVVLVGWGVDEAGIPYWLCQNSWGPRWGDKGFFKVRRGVDEAEIESMGIFYAQPHIPTECPNEQCYNGGELLADCSCKCFGSWSGPTCQDCDLTCQHGDKLEHSCTCQCHAGYSGAHCDDKLMIERAVTCVASPPAFAWDLQHEKKLSVGTYFQVWPADVAPWNPSTNQWAPSTTQPQTVCGDHSHWKQGAVCPNAGSIAIKGLAPGKYQAYVMEFLGFNEFGVSRGYMRPQPVPTAIEIAHSCGVEVMQARVGAAIEMGKEIERARFADQSEEVDEQEAARRAWKFVSQVGPTEIAPTLRASPQIAFTTVDLFITPPGGAEAGERGWAASSMSLQLCPAEFRGDHAQRNHVAPNTVCTVFAHFPPHSVQPNAMRFKAADMPAGTFQVELLINGQAVAEAPLTVAHVNLAVHEGERSDKELKLLVSWQVVPPEAATARDWVGVYRNGVTTHVAGDYANADSENKGPAPVGHAEFTLQQGVDDAEVDKSYKVEFLPDSQTTPAATADFQWWSLKNLPV
eukprot:CAMPEP_0114552670 /NCGR_PEP_ID=MMETSP0114-20121206/7246_1 /TAXON_ID=31324 /ORGANISM="Goniomonas sp, Strain m" /LENGTH=920 /DNA_ID=CAMNT_0001737557 /DNA_START=1 /DNA_END=2763 /DNA_ORIENTATION=-